MQDVSQSNAWFLIKDHLDKLHSNALEGLTKLSNDRETDLTYKARIAVIKELLKLPQTLIDAANTKRT